ncbi:MAG: hypothetical protein IT252_16680 [Chitinophagaceae bacterium]|jgi:hypothetical protein|nr:hypothetical protein [Chitinophagaceae bacterium]
MARTLIEIPIILGLSIEVYLILIIIAVPIFFFWSWFLKKHIKVDRTRKIATWSATLIVTPIIYLGIIMLFLFGITYSPKRDFDKSQWLTDREGRFEMADDIISSNMLTSKDSNQVKQLLGEPIRGSNNTWIYDMGMGGGGLGFLFHSLIIKFENEKVITVEHATIRD